MAESSSDDDLELMGLAVAIINNKMSKRRVWVKDIYKNRKKEGIANLVNVMRMSNRD